MAESPTGPVAVSVVVPLFNGRDLIADCLASIPTGVEVVVVDDGSTDGAPDKVETEFPAVRLLRNPANAGFGATSNRGLRETSGRLRIVLNSDARFLPGAVDALLDALEPGVGIVGPRLQFADGSHQTSAAAFPTIGSILTGAFLVNDLYRLLFRGRRFRWELGMAKVDHDVDHDVEWVKGACLGITAACFEATGGFDEGYYMYAEETDLCWRARQAGFRVRYVAGAPVVHLGGGSTGDPKVHAPRSLRSEARFFAKAYGPGVLRRWALARAVGAAAKVVMLAVPSLFSAPVRTRMKWQAAALRTIVRGDWRRAEPGRAAS